MNTSTENKVTLRLFAGFLLTSEIRMHLNSSKLWKQESILPAEGGRLVEVHYQTKDYLGRYLSEEHVSLDLLKKLSADIKKRLHFYCPNFDIDSLKICIFPQVFIA